VTQHRILVVDDTPQNVKLLADLLSVKGYEVCTAANGEQALAQVEKEKPDLVLLDVMMPVKNGFEVCQKIRESGLSPKILMLTAKGRDIEVEKGRAMGADDYITKPFSTKELVERVRRLLGDLP
jgi:DNA-binding response OmpR family regulator